MASAMHSPALSFEAHQFLALDPETFPVEFDSKGERSLADYSKKLADFEEVCILISKYQDFESTYETVDDMQRTLMDCMHRCNMLISNYFIDLTHYGKDVDRMLLDRSPVFHLYKADSIMLAIPESIRSLGETIQWLMANQSENCGKVAYRKDIIASRAIHALSDGGHWVLALSGLDRPAKRPLRSYIYTNNDLFDDYCQHYTTPCSLDIERGAFLLKPSYPIRSKAEVIDIVQMVNQNELACYDPRLRKPVKIDCSKSGVITMANLRLWVAGLIRSAM
jgi:hypothetical protein